MSQNISEILTSESGFWQLKRNPFFGTYLSKVNNPKPDISEVEVKKLKSNFELIDGFPRIPAELWKPITDLFFYYARKKCELEAYVALFRSEIYPDQWKVFVPQQDVSSASARADFSQMRDIITGELFSYPDDVIELEGDWFLAGTVHSHHTMKMNCPSLTDDKSERSMPGLHAILSTMDLGKNTYQIYSSIVMGGTRYEIDWEKVIDADLTNVNTTYHPDVLQMIKLEIFRPKFTAKYLPKTNNNTNSSSDLLRDPFHYADVNGLDDDDWSELDPTIAGYGYYSGSYWDNELTLLADLDLIIEDLVYVVGLSKLEIIQHVNQAIDRNKTTRSM